MRLVQPKDKLFYRHSEIFFLYKAVQIYVKWHLKVKKSMQHAAFAGHSVRGSWVVAVIWLLSHLPKEWNSRFLNALLAYKKSPTRDAVHRDRSVNDNYWLHIYEGMHLLTC